MKIGRLKKHVDQQLMQRLVRRLHAGGPVMGYLNGLGLVLAFEWLALARRLSPRFPAALPAWPRPYLQVDLTRLVQSVGTYQHAWPHAYHCLEVVPDTLTLFLLPQKVVCCGVNTLMVAVFSWRNKKHDMLMCPLEQPLSGQWVRARSPRAAVCERLPEAALHSMRSFDVTPALQGLHVSDGEVLDRCLAVLFEQPLRVMPWLRRVMSDRLVVLSIRMQAGGMEKEFIDRAYPADVGKGPSEYEYDEPLREILEETFGLEVDPGF